MRCPASASRPHARKRNASGQQVRPRVLCPFRPKPGAPGNSFGSFAPQTSPVRSLPEKKWLSSRRTLNPSKHPRGPLKIFAGRGFLALPPGHKRNLLFKKRGLGHPKWPPLGGPGEREKNRPRGSAPHKGGGKKRTPPNMWRYGERAPPPPEEKKGFFEDNSTRGPGGGKTPSRKKNPRDGSKNNRLRGVAFLKKKRG